MNCLHKPAYNPDPGPKRIDVLRWLPITVLIIALPAGTEIAHSQTTRPGAPENWHLPEQSGMSSNVSIAEDYVEIRDSIPVRGTKYLIRVPDNWNGTLLSDLDYRSAADSPRYLYLLEQGYALSGTARRPERLYNYDPAHEIHDIVSVFDIFESTFGKPERVIQLGCSGGGTITLAMAEIHPDRIDGAIAACGATSLWMANTHLDALFVLKVLIAPELPIVDLPLQNPGISEIADAWQNAIKDAQQTPEGRARIALAITIGQWPAWGGPGKAPVPEPDPGDIRALQESMYYSLLRLLPSKATFGTGMLEKSGRGQLRWNTGVDYEKYYENGNLFYRKAVENLYGEARLSLKEDLNKINAFPRIASDEDAIKYWSAPGRTHIGEPKVPHLRIHTIGDGLVYPTMAQGYEELVRKKGYSRFYRSAYVDRWGHCSFSLAEWLAAIETVMMRLDTGVWPGTDPAALNELGKSLDPAGEARFCEFKGVERYNRIWLPAEEDFLGGQ